MKGNELVFRSEINSLRRQIMAFCIPKNTLSLEAINTVFRNEETNDQFDKLLSKSVSSLNSESQQAIVKNIITTLSVPVNVPEGNPRTLYHSKQTFNYSKEQCLIIWLVKLILSLSCNI
ncbi:MAG: hypothetical protein ACI9N1_001747 [Flavobacteriales bacterium]|jgi:hypothetical protein